MKKTAKPASAVSVAREMKISPPQRSSPRAGGGHPAKNLGEFLHPKKKKK